MQLVTLVRSEETFVFLFKSFCYTNLHLADFPGSISQNSYSLSYVHTCSDFTIKPAVSVSATGCHRNNVDQSVALAFELTTNLLFYNRITDNKSFGWQSNWFLASQTKHSGRKAFVKQNKIHQCVYIATNHMQCLLMMPEVGRKWMISGRFVAESRYVRELSLVAIWFTDTGDFFQK